MGLHCHGWCGVWCHCRISASTHNCRDLNICQLGATVRVKNYRYVTLEWWGVEILLIAVTVYCVSIVIPVQGSCQKICDSTCYITCISCSWWKMKLIACLHDNLSQIWSWITKFAPNMHHGIPSAGIENRGHWLWPSGSFWPFWLRILGNLTCPHDNSSQIWTGITKFTSNMHPGILSTGIENGGHWPWPSRSFWPFWLRILGNLACPHDNLFLAAVHSGPSGSRKRLGCS